MNELIMISLVFNIFFDYCFVCILPNGVKIIAARPEMPAPEQSLDLQMTFEEFLGYDVFQSLDDSLRREDWHALDEKVNVVIISSYFNKVYFIPFRNAQANRFERFCHRVSQNLPAILGWTDNVIQNESFIVSLVDVLPHTSILAHRAGAPRRRASRNMNDLNTYFRKKNHLLGYHFIKF